jgi:Fe-Mn family superoxide dismutase
MKSQQYPENLTGFTLPELDFSLEALEPFIDGETMHIHYEKHHQAYINNLNIALKGNTLESEKLKTILSNADNVSEAIRNNAGGHYNHSLFWSILKPADNLFPANLQLISAIDTQFGSFTTFQDSFATVAMSRFGSGWIWLVSEHGTLSIVSTPNQDNPLMNAADSLGKIPVMGLDVWEHAYYLKHQNRRAEYVAAWWNVINWEVVNQRYLYSLQKAIS